MKDGLIGVIVPVYKVEKYIAECIESILAQTYTNFRLILVDDGTPDNAGKICDEYAKKDSRITVIHQENAGVTRARARGVEEANDCEFITFIDADDIIPEEALETLITHMRPEINITQGQIIRFRSKIEDTFEVYYCSEYSCKIIDLLKGTDLEKTENGNVRIKLPTERIELGKTYLVAIEKTSVEVYEPTTRYSVIPYEVQ